MNVSALEACQEDLFSDLDVIEKKYPSDTVDKIIRVRDMYMHVMKVPSAPDADIIKTFTARYKVSRPTAYSDLAVVKSLLPSLSKESREFHRWRSREMLLETYKIAAAKMDVRTMERVASTYARIFNVEKEDEMQLPLDKIIIQPFVPVDDPTPLGIIPMKDRDKKIKQLLEEMSAANSDIIDVDFEEPDIDPL